MEKLKDSIRKTIVYLDKNRETLINYMNAKGLEGDFTAVAEAATDIRVLNRESVVYKSILTLLENPEPVAPEAEAPNGGQV